MARQILTSIKVDKELSEELGLIADADHRSKLDELRFLINERKRELLKKGGLVK